MRLHVSVVFLWLNNIPCVTVSYFGDVVTRYEHLSHCYLLVITEKRGCEGPLQVLSFLLGIRYLEGNCWAK